MKKETKRKAVANSQKIKPKSSGAHKGKIIVRGMSKSSVGSKRTLSSTRMAPAKKSVDILGGDFLEKTAKASSMMVSTEFAILVILLIGATFGYLFWNISEIDFIGSEASSIRAAGPVNMAKKEAQTPEEMKTFWDETTGSEFQLPNSWQMTSRNDYKTFASSNGREEIVIFFEENSGGLSPEDLLQEALRKDKNANASLLNSQRGVFIEKRTGDKLQQTARIILGKTIANATYSASGGDKTGFFLKQIVPTFRAME